MPHEFKTIRRVEFADTDMAGIVHFAQFFRYMEEAEHAFYRSLGFSVHTKTEDGFIGFPRVSASCDYRMPLRFEDQVEIHLLVDRKQSKSISYRFIFRKTEQDQTDEVARGAMTVVCVAGGGAANLRAAKIPHELAAQIEEAPREDPGERGGS
jgi:acyl-CoA thioester hydrolase